MSDFDKLNEEVVNGISGKNNGIPMGFNRMNHYVGIRKKILTLVFGATGSGKTSYVHSAYILQPFDWYLKNKDKTNLRFKVLLFSMERSKIYTQAKWISRHIFLEQGILIPIQKLLGWWDQKLTKDEHDLFLMQRDYLGELLEVVDIIEGAQNPTGIYKYVKKYALANGRLDEVDEFTKVYTPNHPNTVVMPIEDHLGITRLEKPFTYKKEAIDKVSEYNQIFRDLYGYSPVAVSMLNRTLSNPTFTKMESFEPTIDEVKESGRPGEDADVVISLFDPLRHRTVDSKYDAEKFMDNATGAKYFRSTKILKNTYGEDDIRIGMAFMGATGMFKELPRANNMAGFDYGSLFTGEFFLTNK